jgi:hypothetical protein
MEKILKWFKSLFSKNEKSESVVETPIQETEIKDEVYHDFDSMTKKELIEFAKKHNISVKPAWKKQRIKETITTISV